MINQSSSFQCLLVNFSSMFTKPSFRNFFALAGGWILCTGTRTITRVIQLGGIFDIQRHHSIFYFFFSRASWIPEKLGKCVLKLVLELLPKNARIVLTVDDTLCRKSGAQIWGGGMHHDALLSNYGRGKSTVKVFSFGHNWVIVCICIQTPWNKDRFMAIPIACRLYRSKKRCPKEKYKKRTVLAREMMTEIEKWIPEDRAYFTTEPEMTIEDIAKSFSLRWPQEEMHRNVKQHLGLEDPQNGWWRRPKGRRRNKKVPGPQPHKERGAKAVNRTIPFVLTIYALVVIWYFDHGCARDDVERARRRAPWYREKSEPSFGDMIAALRRHLWAERNFSEPRTEQEAEKLNAAVLEWMCTA